MQQQATTAQNIDFGQERSERPLGNGPVKYQLPGPAACRCRARCTLTSGGWVVARRGRRPVPPGPRARPPSRLRPTAGRLAGPPTPDRPPGRPPAGRPSAARSLDLPRSKAMRPRLKIAQLGSRVRQQVHRKQGVLLL